MSSIPFDIFFFFFDFFEVVAKSEVTLSFSLNFDFLLLFSFFPISVTSSEVSGTFSGCSGDCSIFLSFFRFFEVI